MKKLFKTTIVIVSEYDPTCSVEIDELARDAMQGESYCIEQSTVSISCAELDGDGVREFFRCDGEDE